MTINLTFRQWRKYSTSILWIGNNIANHLCHRCLANYFASRMLCCRHHFGFSKWQMLTLLFKIHFLFLSPRNMLCCRHHFWFEIAMLHFRFLSSCHNMSQNSVNSPQLQQCLHLLFLTWQPIIIWNCCVLLDKFIFFKLFFGKKFRFQQSFHQNC